MSKPTLVYWNTRVYAQPIRTMLAYAGVEFEDKHYIVGPGPDFDRSSWYDVKYSLGLDFPNLPYYVDGDLKFSQAQAIINHLARKHGLDGKTEEERIRIDVLNGVWSDVYMPFLMMLYYDLGKKEEMLKALPGQLKDFSEYLGSRKWFAGDELTYIDFRLHELFCLFSKVAEGCLDNYDNLKKFKANFEAVPTIANYIKSPTYIHKPFNNWNAQWTGAE